MCWWQRLDVMCNPCKHASYFDDISDGTILNLSNKLIHNVYHPKCYTVLLNISKDFGFSIVNTFISLNIIAIKSLALKASIIEASLYVMIPHLLEFQGG